MKRIFNNLYFQEDKNAIEEFFSNSSDYKLSTETFVKYQPEIEEWFILLTKNMPDEFLNSFYDHMLPALSHSARLQILNSTKFKLPIPQTEIIKYLDMDISFISNMMKQKYVLENVVMEKFQKPLTVIFTDL